MCTVTDNPAPVEFKLSAIGSTPKLAIVDDASTVTFERLLLNRADNKRITLASRSALPPRGRCAPTTSPPSRARAAPTASPTSRSRRRRG